jgi:inorganic pyrophosphatase
MLRAGAHARSTSRLRARQPTHERLGVIIETPKGSRSKYAYDEAIGTFELKFVLPENMTLPVDFGFVSSTLADDGDPLDVIILLDETLSVRVTARLLGVIEAEEREKNGKWERNDRLVAVASHAHDHAQAKDITDLSTEMLTSIESFFKRYNKLHDKEFRAVSRADAKTTSKLVKQ